MEENAEKLRLLIQIKIRELIKIIDEIRTHIVRCSVCTFNCENGCIYLYKVKKFGVSDSFENMRAKNFTV
jgi:Na+-translocating ferredoxin:NAD+ oxidoreductase RNF subunit RnfB